MSEEGIPLRIAQVAPVAMPVRPGEGDSIEQLVSLITEELVRRGHDVTLYATANSETSARLRSLHARGYDEAEDMWDWQFAELTHAGHALEHWREHDVVHAHDYGYAVPFAPLVDTAVVDTPHVEIPPEVRDSYLRLPDVHVVAVSSFQGASIAGRGNVTVIPHGIDTGAFPFSEQRGEYLLFLGRMLADKGPAEAIAIARQVDMPLVLAGPLTEDYDLLAHPEIDGERVRYVGPVGPEERNRLLAGAAALLFPVVYPEPFGLVLIEAMACGTPVLATAIGGAAEIVADGVTGFSAPTWDGLAALVPRVLALDRRAVRAAAEQHHDFRRMVDDHEALYRRLAAGRREASLP